MANSQPLMSRMIRAAKLEVDLYEEVEADSEANGQAFQAVLIASVASGIGSGIAGLRVAGEASFVWVFISGVLAAIAGWVMWSFFAYWLGTRVFKGPETSATYGELVRTIGFSNSPRVLSFFSFIPFLGGFIAFAVSVWALIAGVIAVRQALDFSTGRALLTCVVGWIIYMVVVFLVHGLLLGGGGLF